MTNPNDQLIAEVISIGDEMTSGARLDTNGQWLSRRLGELGIQVAFHTTVGDTLSHNVDVFRIASQRADIVVATGGLGPTRDDLTREVLAELAGVPLELRQDALDHILELFSKRNRVMPLRNQVQAMFPIGSTQIHNPEGSAPGIDIVLKRENQTTSRVFALPGVPAEMKRMFDETVAHRIVEQGNGGTVIEHHVMKFFGTGESDMEQRLGEMIARGREPRIGITVSKATISLRITATANTTAACKQQIEQARKEILGCVAEFHFGDGEDFEQQHAIIELLTRRDQSLMIIELGKAAPLGDWFAAIDHADCYHGGISLADMQQLASLVDGKWLTTVDSTDREKQDRVCDDAMRALLNRVRDGFPSDWILIVDPYPSLTQDRPGPLPAQDVTFWITTPDGKILQEQQSMGGHPDVIQPRIAKAAMQFLRKQLA